MEKRKISSLKGIGEKTEKLFQKIGVDTVEDLIRYYPKGFEIFEDPISVGEVEEGKVCTVAGMVFGRIQVSTNSKMQITTLHLKDVTGTLKVIWYRMPFLRNTLAKGGTLVLRGRIVRKKNEIVMEHPEIFYPSSKYEEKRDTMQPVYSLTAGLTNNSVIKAVKQALSFLDDEQDILPEELRLKYSFPKYEEAIYAMHFPREKEDFVRARKRFVFEEFLLFILSLRRMKESENRSENPFHFADRPEIEQFLGALPYHLTNAQEKVWTEIKSDMQSENVMSRLVQGDVGSGNFLQFLLRMDLYIPFHRSKSYIRIFQDQFLLHLGNVPLLCLLPPACQSRLPALCFLLCKAEVHTFFPSEPAQKNSLFFLLQPLRTEADFLLFFSYSVSFLTASHLFRISLHSLYL